MVDRDPEDQLREIYMRFGVSAQYAQNLENLVALVLEWDRPTRQRAALNLDPLFYRQTLGQLVKDLKARVPMSADLEKQLVDALGKRNYLIHRYFSENAHRLMTANGRAYCLSELASIAEHLYLRAVARKP